MNVCVCVWVMWLLGLEVVGGQLGSLWDLLASWAVVAAQHFYRQWQGHGHKVCVNLQRPLWTTSLDAVPMCSAHTVWQHLGTRASGRTARVAWGTCAGPLAPPTRCGTSWTWKPRFRLGSEDVVLWPDTSLHLFRLPFPCPWKVWIWWDLLTRS